MNAPSQDLLTIAGKQYTSRLLVGSGKYKDLQQTREATDAAGAEIITVAIRRVNIGQDPKAPSLLDVLPPSQYTILPNTAGVDTGAGRAAGDPGRAAWRPRTAVGAGDVSPA